ncbi:hypothetical protein [Chryseobacterium sp.]|uniref:hypothetical protein n=1 Tax=Chryseobacterium sp. TaxID=1871047 RepID=UPI00321BBE5B
MSNKKRIRKKVKSIEQRKYVKAFQFGCKVLSVAINHALQMKAMQVAKTGKSYPSGGNIPNGGETEKIVGSNGSEKIRSHIYESTLADLASRAGINLI